MYLLLNFLVTLLFLRLLLLFTLKCIENKAPVVFIPQAVKFFRKLHNSVLGFINIDLKRSF